MSAATPAPAVPAMEPPKRSFMDIAQEVVQSKAFIPGVLVALGIFFTFQSLLVGLPKLWLADDGYYSHGFLVPFISAYVIYKWWPRLSKIQVKPGWFALVLLFPLLAVIRAAYQTEIMQLMSLALIAAILLGIWFVAGIRWMFALMLPTLYLLFMLPVWTGAIDNYTNPLQIISSQVAFFMLQATGFNPLADGSTVIHLNNFVLDVGVPCSGLKLILAVTAFTTFFMMIARLNFWGNAIMVLMVLPLCLAINGLRIALIGVVGDLYGPDAGMKFHDYSGYITLLVCFFILFKIARWLGWKD